MLSLSKDDEADNAPNMNITLNGEPHIMAQNTSVAGLLAGLGIALAKVAVERNLSIVPRSQFESTQLVDGDKIEIVRFIGGG